MLNPRPTKQTEKIFISTVWLGVACHSWRLTNKRCRLESSFTNCTNGPVLEFLDSSGTLLFLEETDTNAPSREFYRAALVE